MTSEVISARAEAFSRNGQRSAALARSITWSGSKYSYLIFLLLADRHLRDDCYRAYGYFRWADDVVDDPASTQDEGLAFIRRQKELVGLLYDRQPTGKLAPEEQIVADLIHHDRDENSGLRSFILGFLDILGFDAQRRGNPVREQQLRWYSQHLGQTVTDGIQYFVGNKQSYPISEYRHLAATGAHITHMLRDMAEDIPNGFINIPIEYLEATEAGLDDLASPAFRIWVRQQVDLARKYFHEGRQYIDGLNVLRCKLVAYWYSARFERVLDAIEQDNYLLRTHYSERRRLSTFAKISHDTLGVVFNHAIGRLRQISRTICNPRERES